MNKGSKILLLISGILIVILGIICISKPAETLFATAWLLGCFTPVAGIIRMVFTFKTQRFLPNSGSRMISALLEIIIGIFFLTNLLATTASLPIVFALWIMMEGIIIAIQSFDYKKVGFKGWWIVFLLGIAAAVFGFFGVRNPVMSGVTLSTIIGIGIIATGIAYITAYIGVKRFDNFVDKIENIVK